MSVGLSSDYYRTPYQVIYCLVRDFLLSPGLLVSCRSALSRQPPFDHALTIMPGNYPPPPVDPDCPLCDCYLNYRTFLSSGSTTNTSDESRSPWQNCSFLEWPYKNKVETGTRHYTKVGFEYSGCTIVVPPNCNASRSTGYKAVGQLVKKEKILYVIYNHDLQVA